MCKQIFEKLHTVLQNGEKQNTYLICYKITYWFELLFEEHKGHEICKDIFYKNRLSSGSQSSLLAFPGMAPALGGLCRDSSRWGALPSSHGELGQHRHSTVCNLLNVPIDLPIWEKTALVGWFWHVSSGILYSGI